VTPFFSGQLWAAQGYAVIFPSCPIGRGFNSDIPDELSKAAVAAVDAAADRGWVDPARVGIIGQSFGGYSTAAVLSRRSDRFRAGVAVSGTYDEELAWGSRRYADGFVDADNTPFTIETLAYVEKAQVGLGSPPWVDPEAYRRNSPFYQAGAIKSPLLIFHGDLDLGPTSLQQGERFYAALRRTGNAAELVRYWGQGHAQRDPWAVRDEWRRAQAWFGRYVRDATPAPAGGM
jgi:dipeptidyl aminopeptidase/acylaminoacyl peptidase